MTKRRAGGSGDGVAQTNIARRDDRTRVGARQNRVFQNGPLFFNNSGIGSTNDSRSATSSVNLVKIFIPHFGDSLPPGKRLVVLLMVRRHVAFAHPTMVRSVKRFSLPPPNMRCVWTVDGIPNERSAQPLVVSILLPLV